MPQSPNIATPESARCALRLDARVALVLVFAYSVALFFVDTWAGMGVFVAVLFAVLAVSRVRLSSIIKVIVPLLFILAFTVVAHIPQGIDEGFFYAVRILLLAFATLAAAFSYDDAHLVRAFASFLAPLRAVRVPVDDIATMFSIAVRFIPTCMDEFQRVATAQRARGAALDDGGVVERVRQWGSVLVPMLVGLFRRAGVLAQAMESRCYGTAHVRTSLHGNERLGAREMLVAAVGAAVCLGVGAAL